MSTTATATTSISSKTKLPLKHQNNLENITENVKNLNLDLATIIAQNKTTNFLLIGWRKNYALDIYRYIETSTLKNWLFCDFKLNAYDFIESSCLFNDKFLMIIWDKIICINLQTGKTEEFENFQNERNSPNIEVLGASIYVLGGWNETLNRQLKVVESWNSNTKKWCNVADMNFSREFFGTTVLNDLLYVVGGLNDVNELDSVECFDPKTNVWSILASMNMQRSNVGVVNDKRFIYGISGIGVDGYLKCMERYDPQINKWTMLSSLVGPRVFSSCVFHQNQIFMASRHLNEDFIKKIEIYDIKNDQWEEGPTLPQDYELVVLLEASFFSKNSQK